MKTWLVINTETDEVLDNFDTEQEALDDAKEAVQDHSYSYCVAKVSWDLREHKVRTVLTERRGP